MHVSVSLVTIEGPNDGWKPTLLYASPVSDGDVWNVSLDHGEVEGNGWTGWRLTSVLPVQLPGGPVHDNVKS